MVDRFQEWVIYEEEGASAARKGGRREDCPYDKDKESEAWNFWVYGNENAQAQMVNQKMKEEGFKNFYMTTGDLTPDTRALMEDYTKRYIDAEKRLRAERGWKP